MPTPRFTSLLAPHTRVTEEQLATEEAILTLGQSLRALNRRRFLTTLAAAGAAVTLGAKAAEAQSAAPATQTVIDTLNFALNLEFFEAEFYSYGATGKSLAQSVSAGTITGTAPTITNTTVQNPPQVSLSGNELAVATALMQDEAHHIALLQSTITSLGGTPIGEPAIDYSAGGTMPAITTDVAFFAAARQFTTLGNSAYMGGANNLVSNTKVLGVAGQILGAEGQHNGVINYLCALLGISPEQDKKIDAQDVPPNGFAQIFTITPLVGYNQSFPNDGPAMGILRTPQQVLGVAYGVSTPATTTPQTGVTKGGFFPSGLNGNIVST